MDNIHKKIFKQFLKRYNLYSKFKKNYKNTIPRLQGYSLREYLNKVNLGDVIHKAFVWRETPEGWEFWHGFEELEKRLL